MLWIIFAILSYFLLSISSILDKILLSKPAFGPKIYAFLAGITGGAAGILIWPFISLGNLSARLVLLGFLSGIAWIFAIFFLYLALRKYETSRIIPAIGGFVPLFTLGLSVLFSRITIQESYRLNFWQIISFFLLVAGSVFINTDFRRKKSGFKESLVLSAASAFLFALTFFLSKIVYIEAPFLAGLFLKLWGSFLAAFFFIFSKETRNYLFSFWLKKEKSLRSGQKILPLFLINQFISVSAGFFQNLALFFVPMFLLAFIGALEGTKYVFTLVFVLIFSYKWPHALSERISRKILLQKLVATAAIIIGLFLFALNHSNT